MISATFDETNPNWSTVNGRNESFLKTTQGQASVLLKVRKFLALEEVYDLLGIKQPEEGVLDGWIGEHPLTKWSTDVEVDFGISGGVDKDTPIELKFNTNTTNVFRDKN